MQGEKMLPQITQITTERRRENLCLLWQKTPNVVRRLFFYHKISSANQHGYTQNFNPTNRSLRKTQ